MKRQFVFKENQEIYHDIDAKKYSLINIPISGEVFPSHSYDIKNSQLPYYLFEYIISGEGYITSQGKTYYVKEGDCCISKIGTVLSYGCNKSNPYHKIWFSPSGAFVDNMINLFKIHDSITIVRADLKKSFQNIIKSISENTFTEQLWMSEVLNILSKASSLPVNIRTKQHFTDTVLIARQYIESHALENISIADIISHSHTSRRTLMRLYKDAYDETPHKTISRIRLITAIDYIINTSMPISHIAEAVNLMPPAYFTKTFKAHYHITPSEYRNMYHKIMLPK